MFRPASEFVDDAPRLTATGEREVIGIHGLLPITPASSGQAGIVGTKRCLESSLHPPRSYLFFAITRHTESFPSTYPSIR